MSASGRGKRKRLGQHYLVDDSVVRFMVDRAAVSRTEKVLEIGTGRGVLTRELCRVSQSLDAFEIDEENYNQTRALALEGLKLHLGDAFSQERRFDVLVSSLPYSESSTLVEWLSGLKYDRAVVMLQRDFVEKLKASPGDRNYRAISVVSQISSDVTPTLRVERSSFSPPPRVDSLVVEIRPKRVLNSNQLRMIKLLFSQRRRKLDVALRHLGLNGELTPKQTSERVEKLTPEQIESLLSS